jgi:sugar-specific transcriptional regulator TrmB
MNRACLKLLFLILLTSLIIPAPANAANFHDAKVTDISDRKYEPAVIELLDSAERSIIISMYILKPSSAPVALLVKDLTEALQRGVKVEIYLNTRFQSDNAGRRQVIKTLKKLSSRYLLIKTDFTHGKDAWITLEKLPGGDFIVDSGIFAPDFLAGISSSGKAVLLIDALLKDQGSRMEDFSQIDLCRRFYILPMQFHKGLEELRQ